MQTYTILQPLRSLTPSLSLGGVNAPYIRVRRHVSTGWSEIRLLGHEDMKPRASPRENQDWRPSKCTFRFKKLSNSSIVNGCCSTVL